MRKQQKAVPSTQGEVSPIKSEPGSGLVVQESLIVKGTESHYDTQLTKSKGFQLVGKFDIYREDESSMMTHGPPTKKSQL